MGKLRDRSDGGMLAVNTTWEDFQARMGAAASFLVLAGRNGPGSITVAGPLVQIDAVALALKATGVRNKKLDVSCAFHTVSMEGILPDLRAAFDGVVLSPPILPFASCVEGKLFVARGDDDSPWRSADYWLRHTTQPVLYYDALQAMVQKGDVALEVSPTATLTPLGMLAGIPAAAWLSTLSHKSGLPETQQLFFAAGRLWELGVRILWPSEVDNEYGYLRSLQPPSLPLYPFTRETVCGAALQQHKISKEEAATLCVPIWKPMSAPLPTHEEPVVSWSFPGKHGWGESTAFDFFPGRNIHSGEGVPGETVHVVVASFRIDVAWDEETGMWPSEMLSQFQACVRHFEACPTTKSSTLMVTSCGGRVAPGDTCVSVSQACWFSLGQSYSLENPSRRVVVVDVDGLQGDVYASLMLALAASQQPTAPLAIRSGASNDGGSVFTLCLEPINGPGWKNDEDLSADRRRRGIWVVVGGLSGVGLHLSMSLVANGLASRLILTGRSEEPKPRDKSLYQLLRETAAAAKVAVDYRAANVCDEGQVALLFRTFPDVAGVINCAGILDGAVPVAALTAAQMRAVVEPKLVGSLLLDRYLPPAAVFVAASSIASLLGYATAPVPHACMYGGIFSHPNTIPHIAAPTYYRSQIPLSGQLCRRQCML